MHISSPIMIREHRNYGDFDLVGLRVFSTYTHVVLVSGYVVKFNSKSILRIEYQYIDHTRIQAGPKSR